MDTLCAQTGQGEELIEDRELLEDEEHREAVFDTVAALDRGELRVALERVGDEGDLALLRRRYTKQSISGRLLPAPDGPHHRAAPGVHRPEDLSERGPPAVRGLGLRERLLEDLLWFLERPSVTGEEKLLCDDLEVRSEKVPGRETERLSNNLVVRRAEPDDSRERVVLAGHLDTVPEPEGGLPVRVEGERIYGRGASDMKAGDAVMLALLEDFSWERSWAEPTFVFYEREESLYAENGLERVFSDRPRVLDAVLAFLLEPTAGALEVGCVGTAQIEVTRSSAVRLSEAGRGGVSRTVRGRVGGGRNRPAHHEAGAGVDAHFARFDDAPVYAGAQTKVVGVEDQVALVSAHPQEPRPALASRSRT